jgi:hypothetical protein
MANSLRSFFAISPVLVPLPHHEIAPGKERKGGLGIKSGAEQPRVLQLGDFTSLTKLYLHILHQRMAGQRRRF